MQSYFTVPVRLDRSLLRGDAKGSFHAFKRIMLAGAAGGCARRGGKQVCLFVSSPKAMTALPRPSRASPRPAGLA